MEKLGQPGNMFWKWTTQFTPGLDINHDKNAQSRMTPRYFGFLGFVDSVLFYT